MDRRSSNGASVGNGGGKEKKKREYRYFPHTSRIDPRFPPGAIVIDGAVHPPVRPKLFQRPQERVERPPLPGQVDLLGPISEDAQGEGGKRKKTKNQNEVTSQKPEQSNRSDLLRVAPSFLKIVGESFKNIQKPTSNETSSRHFFESVPSLPKQISAARSGDPVLFNMPKPTNAGRDNRNGMNAGVTMERESRPSAFAVNGGDAPHAQEAQVPQPPQQPPSVTRKLMNLLDQHPLTEAEIEKLPQSVLAVLRFADFPFADSVTLKGVGTLPKECFQLAATSVRVSLLKCLHIAWLTGRQRSFVTLCLAKRKHPTVTMDHVAGAHTLLQSWVHQFDDITGLDEEEEKEIKHWIREKLGNDFVVTVS